MRGDSVSSWARTIASHNCQSLSTGQSTIANYNPELYSLLANSCTEISRPLVGSSMADQDIRIHLPPVAAAAAAAAAQARPKPLWQPWSDSEGKRLIL